MNLVFSLTAGLGLFLLLLGILENIGVRIRRPTSGLGSLLPEEDVQTQARRRVSARERLQTLLYQARAPITPLEFLFTSAGLGILAGIATFLATGALLLSVTVILVGFFFYYLYLAGRRDKLAREYEEVQPQVVYSLYFYLKSSGLDFAGMLRHMAEEGPEIVREDWRGLAAASSTAQVNVEEINRLLTYRNSPSFTRIVEALLLFRGNTITRLPGILEDLRRDISLEVEIAREGATHVYGAKRQLLLVALMPASLALVFILVMPSFKAFYQSVWGQILLLGTWVFSAGVYWVGARAATRAALVRPYRIAFPEERPAFTYMAGVSPRPPDGSSSEKPWGGNPPRQGSGRPFPEGGAR